MKYESLARSGLSLVTAIAVLSGCAEDTATSEDPVTTAEPGPTGPTGMAGAGPATPMTTQPPAQPTPTMPPPASTPSMTNTAMGGSGGTGEAGMGGMPAAGMGGMGDTGGMSGGGMGGTAGGSSGMGGTSGGAGMDGMGGGTSGMGGAAGGAAGSSGGGMSGGEFVFTSAEFMDGEELPEAHTCASPEGFQGAPSPSFSWSGAPEGTQSFAMVMMDKTLVDAGDNLGYHSAFWNLPASVTSLPVDLASAPEIMAADVINNGYLGPCPTLSQVPVPHVYTFTLYALPEAMVELPGQVNAALVEELEGMALGSVVLSCESSASM